VYKVESQICSVKQSLIGLHKVFMSLSTLRTHRCDDSQQTLSSRTGQIFFSSVPDGVFNLLSSFTNIEAFGRLHRVLQSNKLSKSHWGRNLRQYALHAEPLFNMFTSTEALRWVLFVRNIYAIYVGW